MDLPYLSQRLIGITVSSMLHCMASSVVISRVFGISNFSHHYFRPPSFLMPISRVPRKIRQLVLFLPQHSGGRRRAILGEINALMTCVQKYLVVPYTELQLFQISCRLDAYRNIYYHIWITIGVTWSFTVCLKTHQRIRVPD